MEVVLCRCSEPTLKDSPQGRGEHSCPAMGPPWHQSGQCSCSSASCDVAFLFLAASDGLQDTLRSMVLGGVGAAPLEGGVSWWI